MLETYAKQLRSEGYRMTPQRWAILRVLHDGDCHLTPLEVYEQAQDLAPGITEATVYRTLSFLVEQGLVLEAHVGNGQLVYEMANRAHHHLVCRHCGQTVDVDHADLKQLYERLEAHSGFHIDTMHVTFFGLCPACQSSQ